MPKFNLIATIEVANKEAAKSLLDAIKDNLPDYMDGSCEEILDYKVEEFKEPSNDDLR